MAQKATIWPIRSISRTTVGYQAGFRGFVDPAPFYKALAGVKINPLDNKCLGGLVVEPQPELCVGLVGQHSIRQPPRKIEQMLVGVSSVSNVNHFDSH